MYGWFYSPVSDWTTWRSEIIIELRMQTQIMEGTTKEHSVHEDFKLEPKKRVFLACFRVRGKSFCRGRLGSWRRGRRTWGAAVAGTGTTAVSRSEKEQKQKGSERRAGDILYRPRIAKPLCEVQRGTKDKIAGKNILVTALLSRQHCLHMSRRLVKTLVSLYLPFV